MKIPSRLNELLAKDTGLHASVLDAITTVSPWAKDNKTVFFPEYTDHSLVHMTEVLASADSLISDNSWPLVTAQDATAILLSVLLHDCALHLTEDGFFSLINGKYPRIESKYVGAETRWEDLWQQYWAEARRFDQRKLVQLLGSPEPIPAFPQSKLDLTLRHRLLVGEFLRRHHARLAHEIALVGIPGQAATLQLSSTQKDFFDLSGFVARSHNLNLRTAVDALEPTKRRVHMGCHVPFVMAILRISDYLQIHSARAPGQLLAIKALSSPVSRGEWKKHESVKEIHQAHDDPESIFVDCEPDTAQTFVGMKRLLADIQRELDGCWAVVGESYGRVHPLSGLGLTVRRIRSNIDNPLEFQRTRRPSYVPQEFKFRTASAELMDLLVAPLYGDKPGIGVRELVQNSVDACLERNELIRRGMCEKSTDVDDDVVVTLESIDGNTPRLIVEDYGVGMSTEIVDKYFLNIGASFRSSDLWRNSYEVDGHSTIHRTGRFGIGVLAAFLLGRTIHVSTRHILDTETDGVSFTCTQGDDIIAVTPCPFHHGTRIEIELSGKAHKSLLNGHSYTQQNWDWYCLERPRVKRRVLQKQGTRPLHQRVTVPACDSDLSGTPWRRVNVSGYDDIIWSYARPGRHVHRAITCNGILVDHAYIPGGITISGSLRALNADSPSIVVFDPDGRFPLNLQRNQIAGDMSDITSALAIDIAKLFSEKLAERFRTLPAGITKDLVSTTVDPDIAGLNQESNPKTVLAAACIFPNGIVPTELELLSEVAPAQLLIDPTNMSAGRGAFNSEEIQRSGIPYLAVDAVSATKRSRSTFLRGSLGDTEINYRSIGAISRLPIVGRRLLIKQVDIAELVTPGNVPRGLWSRLQLVREFGDWSLWAQGDIKPVSIDFETLSVDLSRNGGFGVLVLDLDWKQYSPSLEENSAFTKSWKEIVRGAMLSLS